MSENDDGTGLFDHLILMVENLRLLLLLPVSAGVLTLGVMSALPPTYVSEAVLAVPAGSIVCSRAQLAIRPFLCGLESSINPQQVAAIMTSSALSDSVHANKRRKAVVEVKVGKDDLLRLRVAAQSPKEAQDAAYAVIDAWLKTTQPAPREREELLRRKENVITGLNSVERSMQGLSKKSSTLSRGATDMGEVAALLILTDLLRSQYLEDGLTIGRALEGLRRDDVVKQLPTLPDAPEVSHVSLASVLAALGALLIAISWVSMRQAWRRAAESPKLLQKQQRILAALGVTNFFGVDRAEKHQ